MVPAEAARLGGLIMNVPPCDRGAMLAWLDDGADESVEGFTEAYKGEWPTFGDYGQHLAEELGLLGKVPAVLRDYFHWTRWTTDLRLDYTVLESENGVYVFANL